MQKLFEDLSLQMIEHYLGDILRETGKPRLFRRRRAERQAQPEDHRPPGREGTLRPAGLGRCRHRGRRRGLRLGAARRAGREDGARLSRPGRTATKTSSPPAPAIPASRNGKQSTRRAAARCQDAGRRQPGGLVPGTHGVRPARARRTLDPRLPERARRRRPDQCADQVPRALAPLLPEHARHRRSADARQRPPGAVHDLHLRSRPGWKERVPEVVHEDGTSRAQVLSASSTRATTT
jgi:carbamoyltransferase